MNVKKKKRKEQEERKKAAKRERLMVANGFDETLTTIFARFLSFGTKYRRDRVFQMFIDKNIRIVIVSLSSKLFRRKLV